MNGCQAPNPLVSPVTQNLYRRVEQTLGIRAADDALEKLREYLEQQYGPNCFDSPGFYDRILAFPEEIFTAARLLTINETYFFREEAYFDLLRKVLLPRFARLTRPLRVCSAATSIGCEAYSLAMVLDDYSRTVQPLSFGIDAFDINPEAIETARKGRYTANSLRDDGSRWKPLLDHYTQKEGQEFVIDAGLRKKVRFYTHNLLAGLLGNRYDLIFFRNALIYFSADKREVILNHLADALFDGAFLVLGVSETPAVSHPLLLNQHTLGVFYFRRTAESARADPSLSAPSPAALPRKAGPRLEPSLPKAASPGGARSGAPPSAEALVEKTTGEKAATEKVATDQALAENAAGERGSADKVPSEKVFAERAAGDKPAEKAAGEKPFADKALVEKAAGEKAVTEKAAEEKPSGEKAAADKPPAERGAGGRRRAVISPINIEGVAALIDDHGGARPIAGKTPELLRAAVEGGEIQPGEDRAGLTGDEFFAAVIYLLGQAEFSQADKLLSFIEGHDRSAFTSFLRGEYLYFNDRKKDAEISYKEAAGKNSAFWPAFYRISVLAAEGNPVQYEYKTRKALESIEQGKDLRYEIFIGGFSPDYYRQSLEKRLS